MKISFKEINNGLANEIFVNAATVNDIEVIDALTSSQLRTASNSGVV